MVIILWLFLQISYHLVALEYQILKVDFIVPFAGAIWFAAGGIEIFILISVFKLSVLQGETYEATSLTIKMVVESQGHAFYHAVEY